ncbi:GAP family protein [Streptomyces sp. NBC_01221]|uniref:GAP family protein n=1 Tax=unclassified Streptomyces TaxID=2593676 RepID=UPI0022598A2E|nr:MULTISPECIES: GAP family protein [unclassified Streptomyces]MCX4787341.1 GAP family protein [Streptomyces sp. NBC_01221]MCX4796874.1 GAP family protein [Streptomyces sp. NBC_01242]WSJ38087.1 GAP family protein [Streptomyces sp. NBC_01321]WSU23620.1 GAP family protein [Streptomyces sp. NBC_01108]
MGHAVGDVLGLAAGVAVSPLPIVAIILILATPQGRLGGLLFALGWVLGLAALGAIMLAVGGTGGASAHKHPATWVGALKLALGALLALFGARQWQRRPQDASRAQLPKWMAAIDRFTPVKILGLGLLLSAANLKNAPLTIAAGASISSAGLPVPQQIGTLAIFVVIASLGVLAPLAVYLTMGERARSILGNWRDWAAQHNVAVMAVLFFVLGLKLLGDGISILAT